MNNKEILKDIPPAAQSHLTMLQSVIQRMSTNSTSCKTWCVTLVSALLVVVANLNKPIYTLVAFLPALLFLFLDTYYLSLEKRFRSSHNTFIRKLHEDTLIISDLFAIVPSGKPIKQFFASLISFAIWPFYATLILMIFFVQYLVR